MSRRSRLLAPALLVAGVVIAGVALSGWFGGAPPPGGVAGPGSSTSGTPIPFEPTPAPTPTPRPPLGGAELYGYLPYWQMTESMADYLREVPLSTIALFSVTARRDGTINPNPTGYDRITGAIGRRIIADAHRRDTRVELVFTSFGETRNGRFFGRIPLPGASAAIPAPGSSPAALPGASAGAAPDDSPRASPDATLAPAPWERTVRELVKLAADLGVDGINVDVERLEDLDRPAYGRFLAALRARLVEAIPRATVSVATEAGQRGVDNAAAAAAAGVDRLFMMGYDYHWADSQPGASSPVDRVDGIYTLRWSIDHYVEAGVPRDRILLGLPLYGMTWRTDGPDRFAAVVGRGQSWIPTRNLDVVNEPSFAPTRDELEIAEWFAAPDGDEFLLTYFDSAATLRAKLALARDHGLAGGGFWAIGYERGAPGYLELMTDFRDGKVDRSEAPQP